MDAVILAAGRGRRLRPLTDEVPKALLPVDGRPLLKQHLISLSKAGIDSFIIVVGFLGDLLVSFLEEDGLTSNLEIEFVYQGKQLGSAHALRQVKLQGRDYLVSACDCLYPVEYLKEFLKFHFTDGQDITLALKKLAPDAMSESSTVLLEDGEVKKIIEKPCRKNFLSPMACAPLYIFPPESEGFIRRVEKSKRGEYEITSVIQDMLDAGYTARGLQASEWIHLTDTQDLLRLNFPYLKRLSD
ncbi:MAG: nucleotidyltransferase family protein [Candidatus Altiarchaeota archaeon]|nr:nucleotidyltransferase family protein [Candidatus Altiarchaeota archaeon]